MWNETTELMIHSFYDSFNSFISINSFNQFIQSIHSFISFHFIQFIQSIHPISLPFSSPTSRHFRKSAAILILRDQLPQLRPILQHKRNRRRAPSPRPLRPSRPIPAVTPIPAITPIPAVTPLRSLLRRRRRRKRLRRQDPGRFDPPRLGVSLRVGRVRAIGIQSRLGRFAHVLLQNRHRVLQRLHQARKTAVIFEVVGTG